LALVQLAAEPLFTALVRDGIGVRSVEWKWLH
jgi:hypothetical protein